MAYDFGRDISQEIIDQQTTYTRAQVRAAISYYKSIPQISEDQNPLLFWKSHDSSCGSMLAPLIEAAAEVMLFLQLKEICERICRRAREVLTKYRMSLHSPSFQRILMANCNAPKWQGIKGVTIPDLHDEVDDHEVLTLFPQLLCMPMIYESADLPSQLIIGGAASKTTAATVTSAPPGPGRRRRGPLPQRPAATAARRAGRSDVSWPSLCTRASGAAPLRPAITVVVHGCRDNVSRLP